MAWWSNNKNEEGKKQGVNNNQEDVVLKQSSLLEEFSPKNYEEVEHIANALILDKQVKLNLQETTEADKRRIVDFLCGIAFVLDLDIEKTENHIFEFRK